MPFKPREIPDTGLFQYDFRHDGSKFWWLDPRIRPIVGVGQNGRFHAFGHPLDLVETVAAGNVGFDWPDEFVDGQIWSVDNFTILSAAGADYTGLLDGLPCGNTVTVAALASGDLLGNRWQFDAQVGVAVTNGAAADAVTIRGRRIA